MPGGEGWAGACCGVARSVAKNGKVALDPVAVDFIEQPDSGRFACDVIAFRFLIAPPL